MKTHTAVQNLDHDELNIESPKNYCLIKSRSWMNLALVFRSLRIQLAPKVSLVYWVDTLPDQLNPQVKWLWFNGWCIEHLLYNIFMLFGTLSQDVRSIMMTDLRRANSSHGFWFASRVHWKGIIIKQLTVYCIMPGEYKLAAMLCYGQNSA